MGQLLLRQVRLMAIMPKISGEHFPDVHRSKTTAMWSILLQRILRKRRFVRSNKMWSIPHIADGCGKCHD